MISDWFFGRQNRYDFTTLPLVDERWNGVSSPYYASVARTLDIVFIRQKWNGIAIWWNYE